MNSRHRALSALSLLSALSVASQSFATQLPPDPEAFPSSGVQHPPSIVVPKSAPPTTQLDYRRNLENYYGNSSWGGGYRVYEHVRAPSPGFQSINFDYHARGRLFGKDVEGFRLYGATWNPHDTLRSSNMKVLVLGQEIFSDSEENRNAIGQTEVAWNRLPFDRSLVKGSKTFTLGPVPVTVTGEVRGDMGINVAARAARTSSTASSVSLNGTAFARLYGRLSAGVGIPFASAGVSGQVTLAELRAGKNVSVARVSATRVNYDNNFRVVINSLDGHADLYATLFGNRWDKKILDWDGYRFEHDIARQSGSIQF